MKNNSKNVFLQQDDGISNVMGIILMVALTVILAGVIMALLWGIAGNGGLAKTPTAMIGVQWVKGGVPDQVRYDENVICLEHRGGDSLDLTSTSIVICGEGSGFIGKVGAGGRKE